MTPKQEEPIILTPMVEAETEAALLIVPGAYINGQYYQPLGETIQAASPLKLWVGLVRPFPLDLPNPLSVFPDMEKTLQVMRDLGMTTDNIFISGHSLGGVVLQNEEWSQEHGVVGWVMLASYLPDGGLNNVSLPVMHISGDLDGMVRVTHIRRIFRELEASLEEEPENVYRKPVMILQDVNHMHFASGNRTSSVEANDILSPMSQEEAQVGIARHVTAFLTVVLGQPELQVVEAKATLALAHQDTKIILQASRYLPRCRFAQDYMEEVTEGDRIRSPWSEQGQWLMSTVLDQYSDYLQRCEHYVVLENRVAEVSTSTYLYPRGIVVGTEPLTSKEMGVKFKSRQAIMEVLEPMGVEFGNEVSCLEVNQASFTLALSAATDIVNSRFNSRGKPVYFLEDDIKLTDIAWVDAHLLYNITDTGLEVTSPSLVTDVDVGLGLGGMHYCKLLTPTRALEYIMIDSLVGTQP
ncbi:uncharacterized protein [Cherax quadricarinatus]|uniref:uncharacterized protein n=1 Tax=Cherax quadricarinatus TaxID=27406 RepID=UPI00387E62E2